MRTNEIDAEPGICVGLLEYEADTFAVAVVGESTGAHAARRGGKGRIISRVILDNVETSFFRIVHLILVDILFGVTFEAGISGGFIVGESGVVVVDKFDFYDFGVLAVNP